MGWWINTSNVDTSKLDNYTVLDTVYNLDWQKIKDKEYMVVKISSMFGLQYTFFRLARCLKHDSSYRGKIYVEMRVRFTKGRIIVPYAWDFLSEVLVVYLIQKAQEKMMQSPVPSIKVLFEILLFVTDEDVKLTPTDNK